MVFYFSGTGNSLWAARQVAEAFGEQLIAMADELRRPEPALTYPLRGDERVFFVFPVHSWGPAVLVTRFIARLRLDHYHGQPVYALCTCGDNCGYTDRIMQKALAGRGIRLTQTYSLQMPNNYILMKGFGVDDEATKQDKLATAPARLDEILADIRAGRPTPHYVKGSKPWLKSRVIRPLFCRFVVGRNEFHATDACTSCGLCAKVCPVQTIALQNGRPAWGDACVQCTACIHRCPARAIEYGNITQGQGRYVHPGE